MRKETLAADAISSNEGEDNRAQKVSFTREEQRRRVLIVSYTFPPVGGAGVQRAAKFVKYLRQHNWEPSVLTVSNPSVPIFDTSLNQEIPPDIAVERVKTWEPGYAFKAKISSDGMSARPGIKGFLKEGAKRVALALLQPDPQVLWMPNALAAGKRLLKEMPHDVVFATAPPFSSLVLGRRLARAARLPLVVDYRDEWTLSNTYWENRRQGRLSHWLQIRMENKVLRQAQAIVATTQRSAKSLQQRCEEAGSAANVSWIYNGYDEEDFVERIRSPRDGKFFRLVYTGTLWNLASVGPLVDAIHKLTSESPELAEKLELVVAGRRTDAQSALLQTLQSTPCRLVVQDYVDHSDAIELLCTADALVLLQSDLPGTDRIVSAKLFEYFAACRPILAIVPPGETAELLKQDPTSACVTPRDVAGIARFLADSLSAHSRGERLPGPADRPQQFSRHRQAGELAELLNSVVSTKT